jgi:2,4-dienoyl-CoA reductase-like NADH-dependent reductase (Old Yellow Enzyme family)
MSQLFSPVSLGRLQLPNRIVIAPMCQYSAENGEATDWHLLHYGNLALSGAGMLILEATAVEPIGRISPADLGLWSEPTEDALGRVLRAVRRYSRMPVAIQLAHAGRKASTQVPWNGGGQVVTGEGGWPTVAPSAVAFAAADTTPQPLDAAGLARIEQAFVDAARRARRLGVDAIEIHAAHGYLLHQFLSPLANLRTDQYGGTLENRLRFPLAVFAAVRAAVPELSVGIRISATDWVEGGWDVEQSVVFALALRELGCDFIHVSSGGLSPAQKITLGPGYQVPLAERIRRESGLPTMAVGLITEAEQAEAIIAEGRADMVALARGILFDPRWPWHAAARLGAQVEAPPQYWRSLPHGQSALFGEMKAIPRSA